jgi:hypothetical protein
MRYDMELAESYNVTEFRKQITSIIRTILATGQGVTVTKRRSGTQAVLLPGKYKVLAEKQIEYAKWLAFMFTEQLLPDAPSHLKEPQMKELENLPLHKLKAFLEIKSLPLSERQRSSISRTVGKTILQRLEKRHQIAQAIAEAEKHGLYNAVEGQTGEVDLK